MGYAPAQQFELGARIGFSYEEVQVLGRDEEAAVLTIIPYAALNVPISAEGRTVLSPSVGVGYAGSFETLEGNAVVVEAGAELKFFVAKDASIDLGLMFQYTDGDVEIFGIDFEQTAWSIGPQVKISIWP